MIQKLQRATHFLVRILLFLVGTHLMTHLHAQTGEQKDPGEDSALSGTVLDPSGAVLSRVAANLRSRESGRVRSTISDDNGNFRFQGIAAGNYELACKLPGFAVATQDVVVSRGEQKTLRIRLQPEAPRYSVTVSERPEDYRATVASSTMRVETPLIEIPQSIQVVTKPVMEDRQITRVADAAEVVADVSRTIGFSEAGDRYIIRGFLLDYSLRDGFKNNSWASLTDTASVERVEVLKGPAGILYGKVEPGGVVNVVTKRAIPDWHVTLQSVFDTFGSARPSLDITGPLTVRKQLVWRLNAAFDSAESPRDFVHSHTPFVAPALTWRISSNTTFSVEGEYMGLRGVPDVGLPNDRTSFMLPVRRSIGQPNDTYRNENKRFSYFLEHRFSDHWKIAHAASYLGVGSVRASITPAFPGAIPGGPFSGELVDSNGNARRDWEQLNDATRDYGTHTDVVGNFTIGRLHNTLLAGFELMRDPQKIGWAYLFNSDFPGTINIPAINLFHPDYSKFPSQIGEGLISPPILASYTAFRQREKSDGVYLQDQLRIGAFQFVLGGRGDFAASDRQIQGFYGGRIKDSFNHFSPHLGLVYRPIPVVALFASYSQSFTYLPFNPLYFRLANPLGSNQTHGIQFEGGLKVDVWRNRVQATASYFYLYKDNLPVFAKGNLLKSATQLSRGAEFDLTGQFTRNWAAIIAYAYDNVGYAYGKDSPDVQLAPIWNAPLHSGNLWMVYTLRRNHLPNLIFGGGANYRGQRYFSVFTNLKIPTFTRVDAMVAWQFRESHWRLQFNAKDLTNHRYYETDAVTMYLYPYSRMIQASAQFHF